MTTREAEPGEFPKMLYFKGDATNYKIVDTVEAEDALGEDWIDRPIDPLAEAATTAAAATPTKKK